MLNPLPGKSPITFATEVMPESPKTSLKVLAGTLPELLNLQAMLRVEHAVIVFSGAPEGFVGQGERDLLWKAFQVPVFEQHFGADGELVGWECEAHDGLHLAKENAATEFPVSSRKIVETECDCGRSGPRLVSSERNLLFIN